MTAENFCYWLNGYLELTNNSVYSGLTTPQLQIVKDHLDLVFNKVTPKRELDLGIFDFIPDHNPAYSPPKQPTYCDKIAAEVGYKFVGAGGYQKLCTAHTGVTAAGLC